MRRHNEKGTREDLALYRLDTAKSDVKAAKILLEAEEFRGANNRAYYAIYHALTRIILRMKYFQENWAEG